MIKQYIQLRIKYMSLFDIYFYICATEYKNISIKDKNSNKSVGF